MNTDKENADLIAFWDQAFVQNIETMQNESALDIRDLAPSEELYLAAVSMAEHDRVLDYGCGSAWASLIMADHGCRDITAADPAAGAVQSALLSASHYHLNGQIYPIQISGQWLNTVPDKTYDGIFCSNVLDVIPEKTAEEIVRQFHRIAADEADVIIGMNYCLSPEAAAAKGLELVQGRYLYVDGILRLVSHTDEEWEEFFSPYFEVKQLQHFAWPNEKTKTRRLFHLKKKTENT